METKSNNLFLVKDHNSFDDKGVEFTSEMLTWPIHQYENGEELLPKKYRNVIKDALFAASELSPFTIKISLGVDLENKRLFETKRMWGKIYLDDKIVLSFTRDTRHDNAPFVTMFDWVEMMNFASWPEYEGHDAEFQKVLDWSSRKNWKQFFKERLQQKADKIMQEALIAMQEATNDALSAVKIKNKLKEII